MTKPSEYHPWLEQFQTADDAAWSAWKEVQTLSARVAELEAEREEIRPLALYVARKLA